MGAARGRGVAGGGCCWALIPAAGTPPLPRPEQALCVYSELKWWLTCQNDLLRIPKEPACPHSLGESCFSGLFEPLLTFGSSVGAPCFSRSSCFLPCSMSRASPAHASPCVTPLDPKEPSIETNGYFKPLWIRPSF